MSFRLILRSCKVVSREEAPSQMLLAAKYTTCNNNNIALLCTIFPRRSDTNKKLANGPLTCKQYHQKRYLEKFITGEKNLRSVITVHLSGAFVRNCKHEEVKIPLSDVFVPFCGILGIDKPIWEIPWYSTQIQRIHWGSADLQGFSYCILLLLPYLHLLTIQLQM